MSNLLDEVRRTLAILELEPGVSWQKVKDRYRFLAKVWHPDRFGADMRARSRAEKQFKTVNTAYQWLLQHRSVIDSLAESAQTKASAEESAEHSQGGEQQGPAPQPEERHSRPSSAKKKEEQEAGASTVEKFLWGVIATFALIAAVIFTVTSLPDWLDRQDPGSALESASGMQSPSASAPATGDEGTDSRSRAVKYVTASRLYVRSEPNRNAAVVSVLERGDRVRVQPGSGTWMAVVTDDGRRVGWLHGDYLSDAARTPTSSSPAEGDRDQAPFSNPVVDFATFARANQSGGSQPERAATGGESKSAGELELIRGAWKPKNPDPRSRGEELADTSNPGSDLERWSGGVDGAPPRDLPRVTIRLYEDVDVGKSIGTAVYWHQAGACTYALELREQVGDWMRTEQKAEASECAPQGEIWFHVGETDLTAIWHRLDGSEWFSSRLSLD